MFVSNQINCSSKSQTLAPDVGFHRWGKMYKFHIDLIIDISIIDLSPSKNQIFLYLVIPTRDFEISVAIFRINLFLSFSLVKNGEISAWVSGINSDFYDRPNQEQDRMQRDIPTNVPVNQIQKPTHFWFSVYSSHLEEFPCGSVIWRPIWSYHLGYIIEATLCRPYIIWAIWYSLYL